MRWFEFSKKEDPDDPDLDRVIETIRTECKPFLEQIGYDPQYNLYRGIRHLAGSNEWVKQFAPDAFITNTRTDRKPTDMPISLHKYVDQYFLEKFGVRFRSEAVFATGYAPDARSYGTVYQFFPVGNFKFCWSPDVKDMFVTLQAGSEPDFFVERFSNAQYQDTDLQSAIRSKNEIMFSCKSAILIQVGSYDGLDFTRDNRR